MHASLIDQKVLGYLGRALSLELSAVQLYSTQARLVANWGLDSVSERFHAEAREEMQHAERIIGRMLARGSAPGSSQLRPVKLGTDLLTLLKIDQQFEKELVSLYQEAVTHCLNSDMQDDRIFFQALLDEEKEHAATLQTWIESLGVRPSVQVANRSLSAR